MPQAHPWHEVSPGTQTPQIVEALIEIPKGSHTKYEVDKPSGLIRVDRVLFGAMFYPINYGFIPQTLGGDHDPLDILVLSDQAFVPLSLVRVKVIGVMRMIDQGELDDKIIAVPVQDVSVQHYNHINELPPHSLIELRNFFEVYKQLENKTIAVEDFQGPEIAYEIIDEALAFYKTEIAAKR